LQASGEETAMLPIAISYERVPEEASFGRELAGEDRQQMRLSSLLGWTANLVRGRVHLGRIHLAAGAPVLVDPGRDAHEIARDVTAELQRATVVTSFHLGAFLARNGLRGLSEAALAEAVRVRGGRV